MQRKPWKTSQCAWHDEVVAIQTTFVKEAFEHAVKHVQKFNELLTAFPAEMTKTYQDAWLKSVDSTVKATETASQNRRGKR